VSEILASPCDAECHHHRTVLRNAAWIPFDRRKLARRRKRPRHPRFERLPWPHSHAARCKIVRKEGRAYQPDLLMQPEDAAEVVAHSLRFPRTAEVTDISIRPMQKSY